MLELHWPGDSLYFLGWASYPRQVGRAAECGRLLKEWITDAPEGARFILVGHSLGCRLILEALKELESDPRRRRVKAVCLMSAAVPVRAIEKSELNPVKNDRIKWNVLYSPGDTVLKASFPVGQAVARDSFLTRAIGFAGEPRDRGTASGNSFLMYETWKRKPRFYRHSWYWWGGNKKGRATGLSGDGPWIQSNHRMTNLVNPPRE